MLQPVLHIYSPLCTAVRPATVFCFVFLKMHLNSAFSPLFAAPSRGKKKQEVSCNTCNFAETSTCQRSNRGGGDAQLGEENRFPFVTSQQLPVVAFSSFNWPAASETSRFKGCLAVFSLFLGREGSGMFSKEQRVFVRQLLRDDSA